MLLYLLILELHDKNQNYMNTNTSPSNSEIAKPISGSYIRLYGFKSGMTQYYSSNGDLTPVTIIALPENYITQVKTTQNEGYQAIQVGVKQKKVQSCNKAEKGHFKKSGFPGFQFVAEVLVDEITDLKEGQQLPLDLFKEGETIDVTAISKGKGFQGVMKRHNFSGGPKSHGASVSHRSPGSIGNRADPAKTFKNKKMAGHMGAKKVTVHNLKVLKVDLENNFLIVKGSVPGPKDGLVILKKAAKC